MTKKNHEKTNSEEIDSINFEFSKENIFSALLIIATAIAVIVVLPWVGAKVIFGFAIFGVLPFYLIISQLLDLKSEAVIASVFLGLVFPSLIMWYVDRVFKSLAASMIVTTVILYGCAAGIYYYNKQWKNK